MSCTGLLDVADGLLLGEASVPFLGAANLWVEDSLIDRESVQLVQEAMRQAITRTHPGQLQITVFDENLTGLAAPFAALNNGGERLLDTLIEVQDLTKHLRELRQHIQAVNGVMQAKAPSLTEFRAQVNYPVEGYRLLVISTDVSALPDEAQNDLAVLFKAGPRAGVCVLIHSMTLGVNPYLVGMCDKLTCKRGVVYDEGDRALAYCPAPTAEEMIYAATSAAYHLGNTAMAPLPLLEVQPWRDEWTDSSADGITFALGRYGNDIVEVTLGDHINQRHNALITGAVGQGKSNLISVIIHSLCTRYSPDELALYLLDFKEGVTLQPLSGAQGAALPHARVLGLEADREFGLSVLRELFDVYKERLRQFKTAGVQGLNEFRALPDSPAMPRIVLVIDEFQMLFAERDQIGDEIAQLLIRAARLFRAAGIHLILASQTIGGNVALMGSAGDSLFSQIPVRIALKNSVNESRATLDSRNEAAAHLRAREAIVNLEYGIVAANRKTSIAFADPSVLPKMRENWAARARDAKPPFVFDGEAPRSILDDLPWLTRAMRGEETTQAGARGRLALLGTRVDVSGEPLAVPLNPAVGRNIAVLDSAGASAPLVSMALGLAVQNRSTPLSFLLLSGREHPDAAVATLAGALRALGQQVTELDANSADAALMELLDQVERGGVAAPTFLFGFDLERLRKLPPAFADLCRSGSQSGVHIVGQWAKYGLFADHVGYGGDAYFDTKVVLRTDSYSAKQFLGDPLLELGPRDNRATASDFLVLDRATTLIPYTLVPDVNELPTSQ